MSRIIVIMSLLILLSLASASFAGGKKLPALKFEDVTSPDLPLKFKPQKAKWSADKVRIWGIVKNNGDRPYEYVQVSFTALDKKGNFLGRNKWYIEPSDLSAGSTGDLDSKWVDSDEVVPAKIQFKVMAN